jgi:protein-disulfide isomerase
MARSKRRNQTDGTTVEIGARGVAVGLAVLLTVIAVVGWLALGRGEESPSPGAVAGGAAAAPTTEPQEPGAWFTVEGDPALGSPTAPVVMVEYSDYQCPNCRQFAEDVVPWLRRTWLAQGLVRLVFRDFAIRGSASALAAQAAHCAGEQGLYWTYHDALFAAQGSGFSEENLVSIASDAGLDAAALSECLSTGRYEAKVTASTQSAHEQGFQGTPTFVINGRTTQGAIDVDRWDELFQAYAREFAAGDQETP